MLWLLKDFDLLSVLLRAATLSFEALTLGGTAFLLLVALPAQLSDSAQLTLRRAVRIAALAFAVAQISSIAVSSAILIGGSGFSFHDVLATNFFRADLLAAFAAVLLCVLLGHARLSAFAAAAVLAASVATSHAAARLDHRPLLLGLTAAHHTGTAIWIGAMPFLLLALRSSPSRAASVMVRRYSMMAMAGAALLLGAGLWMAWFYVRSWQGLYGTTYGAMLLAKGYLFLLMIGLGAGNFLLLRRTKYQPDSLLVRLRRFSEAEIGLGFTAILVAASLTSQPPAVDLTQDRLTTHDIVQRMHWETPRLKSPPLAQLAPPTSMAVAVRDSQFTDGSISDANDRAWSEYNHHWAGLIVLAAGLMALLAQLGGRRWAGNWPLLFIGLAIFILLRADPENWPLGPRSFWQSFAQPDVLEHRLYAVLITVFAFFEWGVETGRIHTRRAAYVFPLLCAAGGALLITHSHALSNIKDEMLTELSHTPIALLGATAGWARWLELRLPSRRESKMAGIVWPLCLVLVGLVLLDYREM
ncbi:copper resistance D family protein [Acidipila rosea]|uniref:Putative copper resistance protein D n=1 Tax=Acidipila rosea TaxID=768535 RepID=A0A4R1LA35_9BACT|nr:CopD family protein [Acidipila rosea]TCK74257.1 putative copper resistance protein D [Acidipila rosea]